MAYATMNFECKHWNIQPWILYENLRSLHHLIYKNGVYKTGEDLSGTISTSLGHSGLLRCNQAELHAIVFWKEEENLLTALAICTYLPMCLLLLQHNRPWPWQTRCTQAHACKLNSTNWSTNYLQHQFPATYGVSQQ